MSGGIANFVIGVLALVDKVLDAVVDLSAAEPLTTLGSANVRALAEIAIGVVQIIAKIVESFVMTGRLGGG